MFPRLEEMQRFVPMHLHPSFSLLTKDFNHYNYNSTLRRQLRNINFVLILTINY